MKYKIEITLKADDKMYYDQYINMISAISEAYRNNIDECEVIEHWEA